MRAGSMVMGVATFGLVVASCQGGQPGLEPVNGTELFVRMEGAGDPVVVVHGGPVLDHGYLVDPLRALSEEHRLIFYDQRLSGRSAGVVDSGSVSLGTFVEDIEALRRRLDLGRIHILAHSWGGLIALKYALAHGDQLRSLVLISPMAPSSVLWQEEEAALSASLEPADTAGRGVLQASAEFQRLEPAAVERMLQLSFRAQFDDPALAETLRFHIAEDYGERSRQFSLLGSDLSAYDLRDSLRTLEVPTLVVYGGSEPGAKIGAEAFNSSMPAAAVEVIPEAGHFVFIERPRAFTELVREFLQR